ncbi:MAG: hypothetical protein MZV63_23695 [Marinilabiliales bacterium]|nr:hypothetical protein [Marinilabiliales bacterium]
MRQVSPTEAIREAKVVADQGGRSGLAAEHLGLDDDDPQAFGRRIDRSGKPGGARTDHRNVNRGWRGSGCIHPQRPDDFERGGLYEDLSVVQDRNRQRAGRPSVFEKRSALRRVGFVEAVRNPAALEVITELVAGLRPAISDYSDDLESRSVLSGPLAQEFLDSEVESLVRLGPWSGHDPVDFAPGGSARILIGQCRAGPARATLAHEEGPLRVRVRGLSLRQQFDALAVRQPPVDKQDRQVTPIVAEALQPLECQGR